jgi:hypothetical protein
MAARKTAESKRAEGPSLIALSDVEHVFDSEVVRGLAITAKLPTNADMVRFAASVQVDVRTYLEAQVRLSAPRLRAAIKRLYRLSTRAKRGSDRAVRALAHAVDAMPTDLRSWLAHFCTPPTSPIPTGAEILSPTTRQRTMQRLSVVLSHGGAVVIGRKRSGGKRSQSFKPLLNVPTGIERKRPRGEAEREFVQSLALTYLEGTGKEPPYTAREASGPFCNFVSECFELAGAPSGNVPRLINEFGKARRAIPKSTCHGYPHDECRKKIG